MTDIMAPLPPATSSTPSPRAEPVSRPQARFGPALAEAQRHDVGRSDASERASESSERDRETTAAAADEAPKAERPPSSTEEKSTPERDSHDDGRPVTGGEPPRTTLPAEPETAEPTDSEATTTSDLIVGTPHDHPSAKGAVGDGGPSTDPTVERAAPPDTGALAMARSGSPEITTLEPASSIGRPGVDAPTELAVAAQSPGAASSTAGDGAMPGAPGSTTVVEGTRTVPGIDELVGSSVAPGSMQTATDDVDGASAARAATTSNDVLGHAGVEALDGSDSGGERPAVPTAERALRTGATQTGDAASAAGADASRTVDGAKLTQAASSAAPAAPAAGPLDPTVGSLWDDVRSGLERMRTSADGQEVRIRLRPAELGELIVQVRTNGDQVAVRLVTTSAAAQQALVDDRLRLAAELARAGFDQGSVDIGQEGATPFGQSAQDADDERGRGRTVDEPAPAATERGLIEQRDPILTQSGRRPGRHAYSTINLTL